MFILIVSGAIILTLKFVDILIWIAHFYSVNSNHIYSYVFFIIVYLAFFSIVYLACVCMC